MAGFTNGMFLEDGKLPHKVRGKNFLDFLEIKGLAAFFR